MSFLQAQIAQLIQLAKKKSEEEPYHEVLKAVHLTGKQYFNTGIQTSDNITFECGFKLTGASNVSNGIFGGRHSTGRTQGNSTIWTGYEVRRVGSSTYTQIINRTRIGQVTSSQNIAINTFYNMVFLPTSLQLNDTSITLEQGTSIEQPMDIYLGAINNDGSPNAPMTGDLTYFKIFNNGVLVSDCVPALNDKLEVCMYDKVRKILIKYTNISGETEAPTFERWHKFEVDYIENTGTAYIPFADITPTTTMGMNIEYAYTTMSSTEPAGVIGTYNGDNPRKDTFFVSTSSGYTQKGTDQGASCGVMVFHRGQNIGTSSTGTESNPNPNYIEPEADVWYTATINWLGDSNITWTNGIKELTNNVGANSVMTNQLRLFSRYNGNSSGPGAGTYNNCKARVRKLQFSDGTTIIRDFKPVVWHNGNDSAIACLYDNVYNKMYTANGSLKAYILGADDTIYEVGSSIQSSAKTEYIELDYFPDKETSLECWTTVTGWGYVPTQYSYRSTNIFGSGSVSAGDAYTFGIGFDGSLTMGRRAGTPITGMNASLDTKYRVYQDKYGASYNDTPLYYGTEEEPLVPPDVQAQGNTLTVFKNPLSTVIGTMKIHYFKINENYITVREAIPVKSGSTIGLYDKASKRFFGNSGSGTLTFNATN